ncbi:2Fe-2S iron-sulfur cluster-binding protein, partial [Xanthomonas arboricola]|uniref:2Fe-2S iron-sulfur cluster-binding protein n=1 Tax=Xanthomonas arboricola TaxID=56448 RepID=UPI00215887DC
RDLSILRVFAIAEHTVAVIGGARQDAGIEVPLSCEQGMCGACLTGVLAGTPDHRDSVLSDSEHAQNRQITL